MLADQAFWTSIRNTAILVCYIPLSAAITVFISALLREGLRGWQVYRAILYIPNLLGLVIIGVVFSIYLRDDGPLNLAAQVGRRLDRALPDLPVARHQLDCHHQGRLGPSRASVSSTSWPP